MKKEAKDTTGKTISTAADAAEAFGAEVLGAKGEERVWVLPLDATGRALSKPVVVSVGREAEAKIDAGDVFRAAFGAGAEEIILAHNHPSGDLEPSKADMETTKRLREGAKLVGLVFLDHLILGAPGEGGAPAFTSLAESTDLFNDSESDGEAKKRAKRRPAQKI